MSLGFLGGNRIRLQGGRVWLNTETAQSLLTQMAEEWRTAEGSGDHHRAQADLLERSVSGVQGLIKRYKVREPIDQEFLYEMVGILDTSDTPYGPMTAEAEEQNVQGALEALLKRNGPASETAALAQVALIAELQY